MKQHEKGEFTTFGDPARHRVRIVASGYQDLETDVRHDDATAAKQTLKMIPGAEFVGHLVHLERPLAGASLHLERDSIKIDPSKPDEEDDFLNSNYTNDLNDFLGRTRMQSATAEGTFRFADLAPGTYRITIVGGKCAPRVLHGLRIEAGAKRDLGEVRLESGSTIQGHVVLGPGQSPADIEMHLDDDWTSRKPLGNLGGTFTFENLAPGAHVLHVGPGMFGGDGGADVKFEIAAGETKELAVDLSAKAPCKIRVTVTRDGKPVRGVTVVLDVMHGQDNVGGQPLGETGDDGVIAGVSAGGGHVSFTAMSPNQLVLGRSVGIAELTAGALFEAAISIRTGELVIQFPSTLTVPDNGQFTLVIRRTTDAQVPFQFIQWSTAHAPFRLSKEVWKDVRCELGALAIGDYEITVNAQSQNKDALPSQLIAPFQKKITIESGRQTVVNIE